ncbi:MAG: T9SS type A sorting domain-containing protein, partial [Bryobacteraceae bacterium]|nr:T9SS type A sorting domain-containing protein [Bryobacteraceae bacterium]
LFGPVDASNWQGAKEKLSSDLIPGETAYVVYTEPVLRFPAPNIEIVEVGHAYRDFLDKVRNDAALPYNSPQDLFCPIGDAWRAEGRSVTYIIITRPDGYITGCTGSLVNNTSNNFTPYILMADHCGCEGQGAANFDFRFFYWETACNTNSPNPLAITYVNGAMFRASSGASDFLLLQMNDNPQNDDVVYAGWNRGSEPPTSSRSLHHSSGYPMLVAQENNAAVVHDTTETVGCSGNMPAGHLWKVIFDVGGICGRSSGSPLFNQDHRVVGQLVGPLYENPTCPATNVKFGRFNVSWTGGGTNSTRLSNWLDSAGEGDITVNATTKIKGPDELCTNGAVYSIPNFRPTSSTFITYTYTWKVSPNLLLMNGQNTHHPTIAANISNPSTGAPGTISVEVKVGSVIVCASERKVTAYGSSINDDCPFYLNGGGTEQGGVQLPAALDFLIIPNPAGSRMPVSLALPEKTDETFHVRISDLGGKIVFDQQNLSGGISNLGIVRNLQPGFYAVQIIASGGKVSTRQWVVE